MKYFKVIQRESFTLDQTKIFYNIVSKTIILKNNSLLHKVKAAISCILINQKIEEDSHIFWEASFMTKQHTIEENYSLSSQAEQ